MKELFMKISNGSAKIGIIGLGYTGLPLAIEFAKKFDVVGYDISKTKVNQLKNAKSYILDVKDNLIKECINTSFYPTNDHKYLEKCDFIIICVPTPLTAEKEPNLDYIKNSFMTVLDILRDDQFIILESTTYPGTSEEVAIPILEKNGLKAGKDFGFAYSPERIDPGNKNYTLKNVPKIVGGISDECTAIAAALFECIIETVIKVKDPKTAEATKMVENIFRDVNIALVNELALIFEKMGIDTWEVIDSASTKPYGFMTFYPGPGVGGHCIPLDPFYLSYRAKMFGFMPRFIETAGNINEFMKIHAVNLAERGLELVGKRIHSSSIAVIGLTYKKNIDDMREAPSIKIIEECMNRGGKVKIYDPLVKSININNICISSESTIENAVKCTDCAIFVVDHDIFKKIQIKALCNIMRSPVIIDCKNLFEFEEGIVYLGIGKPL